MDRLDTVILVDECLINLLVYQVVGSLRVVLASVLEEFFAVHGQVGLR